MLCVTRIFCVVGFVLTEASGKWCHVSCGPPTVLLTVIFILIMSVGDNPHLLLGRIRFLNRCIECFKRSEAVPQCLCFVPREVCYKICKDSSSSSSGPSTGGTSGGGSTVGKTLVPVFDSPHQTPNIKKLCKYNIEPKKGTCIRTTGEEFCNSQGLWVKISKVRLFPPLQVTVVFYY